jgi:hypothetical protein
VHAKGVWCFTITLWGGWFRMSSTNANGEWLFEEWET